MTISIRMIYPTPGYVYVECIDEYMHEDDVITCESDNQFYPAEDCMQITPYI
jgi:hypothetical protein